MYKDPLNELVSTLVEAKRARDKLSRIRDAEHRRWLDCDKAGFEKEAVRKYNEDLLNTISRILKE